LFAGQGGSLGAIKHVVLCDFDGTITLQDTAEWILNKHAKGDWKELDDRYMRGEIGLLECMSQQFALVTTERTVILDELSRSIAVREGFTDLVDVCLAHGARIIIVSAGIDFVIEHFMRRLGVDDVVDIYSANTYEENGHIAFRFPRLLIPGSETFKDDAVRQWKRKGFDVIYFGDGMPDSLACTISDHRFAVKGKKLESELTKKRLQYTGFTNFCQVIPYLGGILDL
jgi:2-hydroxy-3-keto-5-methylthiopentenyl-1-phosphate phosphatase